MARIRSETHEQVTELADREGISFAEALEMVVRREGEKASSPEVAEPIEYEELRQDEEEGSLSAATVVSAIGGVLLLAFLGRR